MSDLNSHSIAGENVCYMVWSFNSVPREEMIPDHVLGKFSTSVYNTVLVGK